MLSAKDLSPGPDKVMNKDQIREPLLQLGVSLTFDEFFRADIH